MNLEISPLICSAYQGGFVIYRLCLLEEFRNEQMNFNKTLLEQLQKQDDYIKNSINERDRKLMTALKESIETKKQIAAIAEEVEKEKERNRKSWWQFWK